ncbi:hypothetical protein PG993_014835 [Apiospora rasikravindrae]|uniref:Zn(2)-C6 fungal-type domain-containing protein n=1 Tax=Apiospora rasikravindrae TaxID=990691 RepID=A0ABR1RNV9_9PEZI
MVSASSFAPISTSNGRRLTAGGDLRKIIPHQPQNSSLGEPITKMNTRDISSIGLSVIFDPDTEPIVDIVFVHGIQGHPVRTWAATRLATPNHPKADAAKPNKGDSLRKWIGGRLRSRTAPEDSSTSSRGKEKPLDSACYWPKDLLPVDLPGARILTWGYDSMVTKGFKSADKSSLFTHAKNFLFALGRVAVYSRPIIFVAHSLGGIVVKEMLANCDSSENSKHQNIIASTAAIMFFGTPHRGSKDLAGYGEVARKAASILLDTNSALLDSLGLRTTDLERSQEAFTRLWRKYEFRVKTFQEGAGLTAVSIGVLNEKVVPDSSSKLDDPREEAETLQGNHKDIARVASNSDPNYVAVIGELHSWYDRIHRNSEGQVASLRDDGDNKPAPLTSRHRASHVTCEHCKLRQEICNSQIPSCSLCQSLGIECIYQGIQDSNVLASSKRKDVDLSSLEKGDFISSLDPALKNCVVASHFFTARSTNELDHNELGMYRSLIYQLVTQDEALCWNFLHRSCPGWTYTKGGGTPWRPEQWTEAILRIALQRLLRDLQSPQRPVLFFIDGLDECDPVQHRRILSDLHDLVDRGVLKVCISSRSSYHNVLKDSMGVTMDDHNQGDISDYVTKAFSESDISTDQRYSSLADTITIKSQGVFLWAVLMTNWILDDYEKGENWNSIVTRLSEVPSRLGDLFQEILSDIPATGDSVVTYKFFLWAILSTQRLRLREWHHIFPFLQEKHPTSLASAADSSLFSENDEQLEKKIRKVSRGLVEVKHVAEPRSSGEDDASIDVDSEKGGAGSLEMDNGETRSVEIIHDSVTQFFLTGKGFEILLSAYRKYLTERGNLDAAATVWAPGQPLSTTLAEGHFNLMLSCLAYLNVTELDDLVKARRSAMELEASNRSKNVSGNLARVDSPTTTLHHRRRSLRREGSVASFSSAGSDAGDLSSRPQEVKKKRESFSSNGGSVSPGPTTLEFRPKPTSKRPWYHPYKISKEALAEFREEREKETMRRFLTQEDNDSNPDRAPIRPDSIDESSFARTRVLKIFPALMHYATTQLFVHAKLAEEQGSKPGLMVWYMLKGMWERYWLLREEGDVPDLLDFCKDVCLQSWVEALTVDVWIPHGDVVTRGGDPC